MTKPLAFIGRKLRGARQYSLFELALVPFILVLLGLARLAILLLPFRSFVPVLGSRAEFSEEAKPVSAKQRARAKSIGRAVRATATVTPWNAVCLPQAMVAVTLLRLFRLPSTAYFGLLPGEEGPDKAPMQAHAWVQVGDLTVTGGPVDPALQVVAGFKRGPEQAEEPA